MQVNDGGPGQNPGPDTAPHLQLSPPAAGGGGEVGGGAWQVLESNLEQVASGSGTGSGHFAYDPDQIRDIIKGWNELATEYQESRTSNQQLAEIEGPGKDFASGGHATVANSSGSSYLASLEKSTVYCQAQAVKFQKALDEMLGVDSEQAAKVSKADQDGGI